jgi:hypothetical protein
LSGTSKYESKSQPTPGSISGARTVSGGSLPINVEELEIEIRVLIAFHDCWWD